MATLKDHQKAMVDLLANGSAIPASAARLAHALHDVLGLLLERDSEPHSSFIEVTLPKGLRRQREVAVPPRGSVLIENLRAELANVTTQRNTYKARCESLEAEVAKRAQDYDDVKEAEVYTGFPKIVDLSECSELAVIPLQHIDHIIARIGVMTGVEPGEIAKVVGAIVAISPKP